MQKRAATRQPQIVSGRISEWIGPDIARDTSRVSKVVSASGKGGV